MRVCKNRRMLARLQRCVIVALLALAAGWCWWWWEASVELAITGAAAIASIHAPVLALEFLLAALLHGKDPVPRASVRMLVRAWWAETRLMPAVFWWRQPFFAREVPDHLPGDAQGRQGVVLIHGFVCNRGFWTPWLRRLRTAGHPFVAVNLEPVFGDIESYMPIVDDAVRRVEAATGRPPVLVCHSMGGLVARAWLDAMAGCDERVAHVVTIGSPHNGTWLGRFSQAPNGRQMRLACDWLSRLFASETPARRARFTCWYSNADNIVFPASTAMLEGADNRFAAGRAHVEMAFDPAVVEHTLGLIASK